MTKNEFDHEMRKMDRRDKERQERANYNEMTAIQNALKLYFSHQDGSTYVECEGGVGYEDYLVEVSNPGNIAGHRAEYLYADTAGDFSIEQAKELAEEVHAASMYSDEDNEIEVIDIDRKALAATLKDLYNESGDEFENMTDFINHYMPSHLQNYNLDEEIAELVK